MIDLKTCRLMLVFVAAFIADMRDTSGQNIDSSVMPVIHVDNSPRALQILGVGELAEIKTLAEVQPPIELPMPVTLPDSLNADSSSVKLAAVTADCAVSPKCDDAGSACDSLSCHQDKSCHCRPALYYLLHPPKTMLPPIHCPEASRTYYYFRPYNWHHIQEHQKDATDWDASPGNPYSNHLFEDVYKSMVFDEH